jgi:hypothetical protein
MTMNQPNTTTDSTNERREALLREAERQGVRPLTFDELLGDRDAKDADREDVDAFLALRRERREMERRGMRE